MKTAFGPCRTHSANGLTVPADGVDGLCAACRDKAAAATPWAGLYPYRGRLPLAAEAAVHPVGGGDNGLRTQARQQRIQAFSAARDAILAQTPGMPLPEATLKAGRQIGIEPKTARNYAKELRDAAKAASS